MNHTHQLSWAAGRVLLGLFFVVAGLSKIPGAAETQALMSSAGVPPRLISFVFFLEVGLGTALLLGRHTRLAAAGLAGFCLLAATLFHRDFGDGVQQILFMKNLAIAGGLLLLAGHGGGAYSMDSAQKY